MKIRCHDWELNYQDAERVIRRLSAELVALKSQSEIAQKALEWMKQNGAFALDAMQSLNLFDLRAKALVEFRAIISASDSKPFPQPRSVEEAKEVLKNCEIIALNANAEIEKLTEERLASEALPPTKNQPDSLPPATAPQSA